MNNDYYDTYEDAVFKVTMRPSASYELDVRLDKDLNLLKLCERELVWIHGTYIHNNASSANSDSTNNKCRSDNNCPNDLLSCPHDIRLKLGTHIEIKPNAELFKFVYPTGQHTSEYAPIRYYKKDNHIAISNTLPENIGSKVSHVRHTTRRVKYALNDVSVYLTSGVQYEGRALNSKTDFLELSINVSIKKLQEYLTDRSNYITTQSVKEWLHRVLSVVLKVSDDIFKS